MNELQQRVLSKLDQRELNQMMRDVIDIPSPTGDEQAVAEYLAEKFRGLGMRVDLQEVEPGRPNVICTLKGAGGGRNLMLTGHVDTIRGMRHTVVEEDGWLFGPGATNMKCAFPAYHAAIKMLLEAGVPLGGDLMVTAVVGEIECTPVDDGLHSYSGAAYRGCGLGTEFMLRHGVTTDMAIIGEPTGLRLQCGNGGYVFAKITTFGRQLHTFSKHKAVNALEKMLKVAQALQDWEPEYQERHRHPRMQPLLNLGGLVGGRPFAPVNTPPWANLFLHVTTIPGTKPLELKAEIEAVVARAGEGDPDFRAEVSFYQVRSGYEVPADEYVAQVVGNAHEQVFGRPSDPIEPTRYSVSSDGSFFDSYGIPSVTYGPGGLTRTGARLNRDEVNGMESIGYENLANCARVYALAALRVCGGEE